VKTLRLLFAALSYSCASFSQIIESEPNDDFSTANFFASGDTLQGKTCAYPEADFFQIILPDDGVLKVTTSISANTPNPGNLTVELYSKYQNPFYGQYPATGADSIPVSDTLYWGCLAADTFYLKVSTGSFGFGYCWDYQLSHEVLSPVFANDAEPNRTPAQAVTLPYNTPAEGHIGFKIVPGNNALNELDDYYKIVTPFDGIIRVFVSAENAGAATSLNLTLLSKTNGVFFDQYPPVGGSGISTTDTFYWGCHAADTFYLRIYINNVNDCGMSYRITYDVTPAYFANDVEPNNDYTEAVDLPYNTPAEGHLGYRSQPGSGSSGDDDDYFRIVTPTDGIIRVFVSIENAGAGSTLNLTLLSKNNSAFFDQYPPVGANGFPATDTLYWGCHAKDTFLLRIYIGNVVQCGLSYRISFDVTPAVFANDVEPNNIYTEAIDLPYSTTAEGHLGYRSFPGSGYSADAADYYKIITPTAGVMRIFITSEVAGVPYSQLSIGLHSKTDSWFGDQYSTIGSNGIPHTDTLYRGCVAADTFYLKVHFSNVIDCGISYRISYDVTTAFHANDIEPNNNINEAQNLAYDTPVEGQLGFVTQPGSGYNADAADHFRIITPSDGTLRIFVSVENSGVSFAPLNVSFLSKTGNWFGDQYIPIGSNGIPEADTIYWGCISADTFYLKAHISNVIDCGISYRISYDVIPPAFSNDIEPNNSFSEATYLPVDSVVEGHLSYYQTGNEDYYQIVLPDGILRLYTGIALSGGAATLNLGLFSKTFSYLGGYNLSAGANNQPASDTLILTLSPDTFYLRLYFNVNDCGSYRFQYRLPSALLASIASSDFFCYGDGNGAAWVEVASGTPPYNYSWSGGTQVGAGDSVIASSGGVYSVTITDASGFSVDLSTFINEPPALNWTITSQNPSCSGVDDATVNITGSGGTPPYDYSLDGINFQSSGSFTGLGADTYNITLRDDAGCMRDSASFAITASVGITATYSINQPHPGQIDGAVKINPLGGTPPYEFSIDGTNYQSSSSFAELQPGTYPVFVRDANGCLFTDSVTIWTTGVSGLNDNFQLNAYPNPADDFLNISLSGNITGHPSLHLTSLVGQRILVKEYVKSGTVLSDKIDVRHLPAGAYLLIIELNGGRTFWKVSVRK